VEALPNNVLTLRENLAINHVKNVLVLPTFIQSSGGVVEFYPDEINPYAAIDRLKRGDTRPGTIQVPMSTYEDICASAGICPDIIFCDIEGFEVDLVESFAGIHRLNCTCAPVWIVELHPQFYGPKRDTDYIYSLLRNCGYDLKTLSDRLIAFPNT
jgi:FkbM family methyltransferase